MRGGLHDAVAAVAFRDCLSPGATVVEVGGNIGYYALLEAWRIGANGKVFALEPRKRNLDLLEHNIGLNRLSDRVQTFHLAATNTSGTTQLQVSDHSNWHRLAPRLDIATAPQQTERCEAIDAIALDDFNETVVAEQGRSIDIVRMDVEGHEVEIIAGMSRLLESAAPLTLFMEMHPDLICRERGEDTWHGLVDSLKGYGFRISAGFRRWHQAVPDRVSSWPEMRRTRETCLVILTR